MSITKGRSRIVRQDPNKDHIGNATRRRTAVSDATESSANRSVEDRRAAKRAIRRRRFTG